MPEPAKRPEQKESRRQGELRESQRRQYDNVQGWYPNYSDCLRKPGNKTRAMKEPKTNETQKPATERRKNPKQTNREVSDKEIRKPAPPELARGT
jgi:hypothetical protein